MLNSFVRPLKLQFFYTDISSLHINCGGRETVINGTTYQADGEEGGASMFYFDDDWALSSTGYFMDDDVSSDNYIATNTSVLSMPNADLYTEARISPLSLTYYGLCMFTGSYTVELHFAETVFQDDNKFDSLGKRLFNVFIQAGEIKPSYFHKFMITLNLFFSIIFITGKNGLRRIQY